LIGNYEGTLVASLGDPEVARWIPVVVIKPLPSPPSLNNSTCPTLLDNMNVQVMYSYVGTFDRPEATVHGILVNYTASTNDDGVISFKTSRDNIVINTNVSIRATVVFVDLTRPPIRTFAEPPTYEFRLPEDFYYPFWSSDSVPGFTAASSAADQSNAIKFSFLWLIVIISHYGLYIFLSQIQSSIFPIFPVYKINNYVSYIP